MADSFSQRMDKLINETPTKIKGRVHVNQVYAAIQHESLEFNHPRGGRAKYLGGPLIENHNKYYQDIADSLLAGKTTEAMIRNMEHLSTEGVYENAPIEFADLKASGHPSVEVNDDLVYDRPPMVHRLSEEELRAKSELRGMFDWGD